MKQYRIILSIRNPMVSEMINQIMLWAFDDTKKIVGSDQCGCIWIGTYNNIDNQGITDFNIDISFEHSPPGVVHVMTLTKCMIEKIYLEAIVFSEYEDYKKLEFETGDVEVKINSFFVSEYEIPSWITNQQNI